MSLTPLFKAIHGEIDFNEALRLVDHPEHQPEGFSELVEIFEADADGFWFLPTVPVFPYFYFKDLFFFPFASLSLEGEKGPEALRESTWFKKQRENLMKLLDENVPWFILSSDKRVRFRLYRELFDRIPDEKKFDTFVEIYVSGEYGFNAFDRSFINKIIGYRTLSEEQTQIIRETFSDPRQYVTIFRGVTPKSTPVQEAYSWTTSLETAMFFATRFKSAGTVYAGEVWVGDILAYCNHRDEEEVLVLPENVKNLRVWKEFAEPQKGASK